MVVTASSLDPTLRSERRSIESLLPPFHRGWALFLGYYVVTYSVFAIIALSIVGPFNVLFIVAGFASLQLLRLPALSWLDAGVGFLNRQVLLWLFRVNFLTTLSLAIAVLLVPFALTVWGAWTFWGAAQGWVVTGLLALLYVGVQLWRGRSDRQRVMPLAGDGERRTVAVIGAGVGGIVAAKECLDEGHEVTVFELSGTYGGVWNADDDLSKRTTGRTWSSSSRRNSFFGDFPMSDGDPSELYPTHYSESDYRNYLKDYVAEFQLEDCFQFHTRVEKTRQFDDGRWGLQLTDPRGNAENRSFDHVVVATGLNHRKNTVALSAPRPDADGHAAEGDVLSATHSASYRGNERYRGQKVVIIGMGESSSDLAAEIADVAREVHVIVRSPLLLLPRNTFGQRLAPDHKLSRLILGCPQFVRTFKLLSQTVTHGYLSRMSRKLGLGDPFGVKLRDDEPYEDNWSEEWYELFYKLGFHHPKARWGLTRNQVTKTAPIVKAYREGKLHFHTTDVRQTTRSSVELDDDTIIGEVDSVVDATGYTPTWPFLPDGLAEHNSRDRYRLVFHPKLPNMSFVGFCRGGVGSVFQSMEMQARWVALVVSGARVLPDSDELVARIEAHKDQMIGKWPTKVTMVYVNALAREEVGCEPNLWEVFRRSPRTWFYLIAGPYCMSMYRFRGPHASPEVARSVYDSAPQLVRPLEFAVQQVLEFVLGSLARFWTSIPPLRSVRKTNGLVRAVATPFVDLEY